MDYSRQQGYFKNELFDKQVHVIGAGATGSWLVLALAKMGVKHIHVWDFDKVEEHNLPNQLYGFEDVGVHKVEAVHRFAESSSSAKVTVHNERVTGSTRLMGVVFNLVDSMAARSEIYNGCVKNKPLVELMIETRMGGDCGFIYAIDPLNQKHQKEYEQTLYSDDVAETSLCGTSIAVLPTGMQIVGAALWQFINYTNKKPVINCTTIASASGMALADQWG